MLSGLKDVLRQNVVRKRAQIHHEKSWVPDPPQDTAIALVEIKPNLLLQINENSNDIAKYYQKLRVTRSVKLLKVIPEVEDESAESTESASMQSTSDDLPFTAINKLFKKLHKMLNMGNRFH